MRYQDCLFSPKIKKKDIRLVTLDQCPQYFEQVVAWAEFSWGYLENKHYNVREHIKKIENNFYIATYGLGETPVGMFALEDRKLLENTDHEDLKTTKHLTYVYIDENYRRMGIGSCLIELVKERALLMGGGNVFLETLSTTLNKFYELNGAKVICDLGVESALRIGLR